MRPRWRHGFYSGKASRRCVPRPKVPRCGVKDGRQTARDLRSAVIRMSKRFSSLAVNPVQPHGTGTEQWRLKPMDARTIELLCRPAREPFLTSDDAIRSLHAFGPRCRFIKTLPAGATVLDAGAGEGSLQVYRHWPDPPRNDLRMFAWAGVK